jgi:hypothetical protein
MDLVRDTVLGVEFEIDPRFARSDPASGDDVGGNGDSDAAAGGAEQARLPTAHFIATNAGEGWIAALAIVTVASGPAPAQEWLAGNLAAAQAAFAQWSSEAAELLVPPMAAELAGRPAVHVRYRLTGSAAEGDAAGAGPVPPSLVEHWTVLVAERRWLLAMELMVQPPELWDTERETLELPFRTLALI